MDVWNVVKAILKAVGWLFQGNQVIILVFVLIGLVLVWHFTEGGPKRWLGMLAVLVTGGLLAKWMHKRADARLIRWKEESRTLFEEINAHDQIIREDGIKVQQLEGEIAELEAKDQVNVGELEAKRGEIRDLEAKRDRAMIENEGIIAAAERVLVRQKQRPSYTERLARLRGQIGRELPSPTEPAPKAIPDPKPVEQAEIVIDGFSMKGDV